MLIAPTLVPVIAGGFASGAVVARAAAELDGMAAELDGVAALPV